MNPLRPERQRSFLLIKEISVFYERGINTVWDEQDLGR